MAPTRARTKGSSSSSSSRSKTSSKSSKQDKGRHTSSSRSSKKSSSSKTRPPSGGEVRTLPSSLKDKRKQKTKQRRTYTDKELGIAPLNKITPAGVRKPTSGKQRGKVFVDDAESMRRIWAVVRAEKDRDVEGKVQRERQLEEVREARRLEMERKEDARRAKLEETKDSLRQQRKKTKTKSISTNNDNSEIAQTKKPNTKRVSFA